MKNKIMAAVDCRLDRYQSACDIHQCVRSVNLIPSTSKGLSPSNGFILTMKNNVTYNGAKIAHCFLKTWDNNHKGLLVDNGSTRLQIYALNYEMWVYGNVIRSLVDDRICPNFNRYLAHGKHCKNSALLRITHKHAPETSYESWWDNLVKDGIQKGYTILDYQDSILDDQRLLVTEYLNGQTVQDYLQNPKKKSLDVEVWLILFQLAVACYALFLSRTAHNDLHSGNVMLVKNDALITYIIDGDTYTINPPYVVKVFDFDHSYVERHKMNIILYDARCKQYGYCNKIVHGHDICTIFGSFYRHFKDPQILDVISINPRDVSVWNALCEIVSGAERPPPTLDWYQTHIKQLPAIIKNLKEKIVCVPEPCSNVYTCCARHFDARGQLKPEFQINDEERLINEEASVDKKLAILQEIKSLDEKELAEKQKKRQRNYSLSEQQTDLLTEQNKTIDFELRDMKGENEFLKNALISVGTTGLVGASFHTYFRLRDKFPEWLANQYR
jgi:hypothetical protein